MNKRLAPLVFIAFVGMAALCAAEPVAVPPNAPTPAEPATTPEPSPTPRPLIGTASAGVGNGIPLSGPAPVVVDPRMGAWRQQWYPPPDMPGQGVEAPPWARPQGTPIKCGHCCIGGFWNACRRLCGRTECECGH